MTGGTRPVITPADKTNEHLFVEQVPYGVVAGIISWNYPVALFARKIAGKRAVQTIRSPTVRPDRALASDDLAKLPSVYVVDRAGDGDFIGD